MRISLVLDDEALGPGALDLLVVEEEFTGSVFEVVLPVSGVGLGLRFQCTVPLSEAINSLS